MSELLVPVRADALWLQQARRVVGAPTDVERLPWFDGRRDRNGSVPHVASAINAQPFGEHRGWLEAGVHLHWSLPDALTRGATRRDALRTVRVDNLWFPPAPNRWLVVLRKPRSQGDEVVGFWLIESDHVHPPGAQPARAIAYPLPGAAPGTPPYVHIGRQIEFGSGLRPLDRSLIPSTPANSLQGRGVTLTALGPGDPLFSAHYPSCQSVFGFHEPVLAGERQEPRHYTVFGWYADLTADPLTRLKDWLHAEPVQALSLLVHAARKEHKDLKDLPTDPTTLSSSQMEQALRLALAERLGWGMDDGELKAASGGFPRFMMCLGSTLVEPGEAAEAAAPAGGRAGIGSSDAEALAALLMDGADLDGAQQQRLVQSLAATDLSSHALDLGTKLAEARHNEQFQAQRGHSLWVIRSPESHDKPGRNTRAELPDDLAHQLNLLNALQETYDRAQDRIAGLRQSLFSDWHRWISAAYPEADADPFDIDVDALRELIERTRLQPLEALLRQTGQLLHGRTANGGVVLAEQRADLPVDGPAPAGPVLGESFFGAAFTEVVPRGERVVGLALHLQPNQSITDIAVMGEGTLFPARVHAGSVQRVLLDAGEWITAVSGEFGTVAPHLGIGRLGFETNRKRRFGPWGRDLEARVPFRLEAPAGMAIVGLRGRQDGRHLLAIGIVVASPLHMEPPAPDAGDTVARRVVDQYQTLRARLAEIAPAGKAFTLGIAPGPRFWRPNDLVLVLDDAVAAASPRHGEDGRGQAGGLLPCLPFGMGGEPAIDLGFQGWPLGPREGAVTPGWMAELARRPAFVTPSVGENWHPIQLEWEVELQPLAAGSTAGGRRYAPDFIGSTHGFPVGDADLVPEPNLPLAATSEYVSGCTILNPAAGRLLQARLARVPTDLPLQAGALAAFQPGQRAPMVLTLGGFHDQLLLRQQEPQIAIADPIGLPVQRAFTARVRRAVAGLHPTTPVEDGVFHPIRSGELLIERLRVIDSFGRSKTWRPERLLKTGLMKPQGKAFDRARLPLRLTQAARLDFRWLSAAHDDVESNDHPASSPVCGWLLPDDLDGAVEVYARNGRLLGSVSSGGPWQPAPRDAAAPRSWREIDELALQRVVRWLTAAPAGTPPADAVGEFVELLDAALEGIDPQDAARHQTRALLIGRPIAVVRARLALVLQHPPVPDPSMTALRARLAGAADDDHGLQSVRIPLRLGEVGQLNDGLCGYWIEDGAAFRDEIFHTPHGLPGSSAHPRVRVLGDEQVRDFPIQLTPDGAPTIVTMLVDPRGVVHAACGVLPVKSIAIPPDQYLDQIAALRATFPVAPVLGAPDVVALPLPAEPGFAWSWLERSGERWRELPHHPTVHKADLVAGFGTVGAALWDVLVASGRIVQQQQPDTGLLMPGDPAALAPALAALKLTPEAVERGLHSLARAIDEADTAAHYGARAVAREGWLQLQPSPAATPRSGP